MSATVNYLNQAVAAAAAAPAALPAASFTETGENIINDATSMIIAGVGLVAILIGVIAGWKSKSLAGALSGFAVGALLVFAAANVSSDAVQNPIEEQINNGGNG